MDELTQEQNDVLTLWHWTQAGHGEVQIRYGTALMIPKEGRHEWFVRRMEDPNGWLRAAAEWVREREQP